MTWALSRDRGGHPGDELLTPGLGSWRFFKINAHPHLHFLAKDRAAMIRKVYEDDPMLCPKCGGTMKFQPFPAVGKYDRFKETARPKNFEWNVYGQNGSTIEYADDAYFVDPDGEGPAGM